MSDKAISILKDYMDERFDGIEKLINISLISSIMNLLDEACQNNDEENPDIERLRDLLEQNGFEMDKADRHENQIILYVRSVEQMNLSRARLLSNLIREEAQDVIPVAIFERFSGKQRKKMLEEHISFWIPDRELYISR